MDESNSSTALGAEFVGLRLKQDALGRYGLPAIDYPVPHDQISVLLESNELPFALMLYWLQVYSEDGGQDWRSLEPAMTRLSELIAPEDEHA